MDIVVNEYPDREIVKNREDFESDSSYNEYLDKHNQYMIFKERLLDYDRYLSLKKEINKKRRETQVLLEPSKGEDERFKSS